MKKLWQKNNQKLDPTVEIFETKDDLVLDEKLLMYDIAGSLAHAKMLKKIGILTKDELNKLEQGLKGIIKLSIKGWFNLQLGDEDMHTKMENYLIEKYGDVGKKIHTGRSRNDQVLTALRLYTKDQLMSIKQQLNNLIEDFADFAQKYGLISIPGYTHMRKAMPSSIALWADSFIASFKDDLILLKTALQLTNQSPLGSGAGYGVPIQLDREYCAKLLGFAKVQQVTYCQNSRGKIEAAIMASLISILQTINKLASDVLLFTTSEFNFFKITEAVTTGSSIMPHKKNVDVAELLRSKLHLVLGNYVAMVGISGNLISGYHRDLQDTKKPLIDSLETILSSLQVTKILLDNLTPNQAILEKAMTADIYAAEQAFELVKGGVPFRTAYVEVKNKKGGDGK